MPHLSLIPSRTIAAVAVTGAALAAATLAGRRKRRGADGFDGRVVLITGGSRGLGLAMARQFAVEGARRRLPPQPAT